VLFEFLPAPYPMSPPDTHVWYTALGQDSTPGAVLNLPANWDRPGYLLYQTVHGKPLTAAYISRDDPRTLIEAAPVLQHFGHLGPDILELNLAAQGQQVLADLGVRWVVLDRYKMPGGVEREYTEATAATIFGGQQPVFEDERITVHEVGTQTAELPYVVLGEGWGPFDPQARTRSFGGSATVDIIAAQPGVVTLEVTPVSGNGYTQEIAVQPGINTVTLTGEPATVLKLRVY